MGWLGTAMWGSLGLIAWTHAGYPLAAAAAAARSRYSPRRDDGFVPSVALVIAAHHEAGIIDERIENALALDYPRERLEIVVALDGSSDGTLERARRHEEVTVLDLPRAGKVAAQDAAVAATSSDVVAFSDANSMWAPDALRRLAGFFADPEVGYVCGRLALVDPVSGRNVEGLYWRYELWQRSLESRLGSITAGNGGIYAVRRSAYPALGSAHSHDISLPHRLRRAGLRSVYDPEAVATEPVAATTSAEWGRKVRMQSRSWFEVLRGGMLDLRGQPPAYGVALVSHRLLRYAAGVLHVVALGAALARRDRTVLAGHAAFAVLAVSGTGRAGALARYYAVVTAASLAGLVRMLREGPQTTWTAAEGTR